MNAYVYISIGGFLGAILRFFVKNVYLNSSHGLMPMRTLIVNVLGSFLLAFLYTYVARGYEMKENIKIGIGTGFLGSFTTFSTFCSENVALIFTGKYLLAASYMSISIFLGLGAAALGYYLATSY